MDWIKHTPGDPMQVDGDTLVHVCFRVEDPADRRKRGAAEPAKNFRWDCAGTNGDIIAYSIVEPAKLAGRWVSVEEQPHPLNQWFWRMCKGEKLMEPCFALEALPHVRFWHPMEQPPAFAPPLTNAEKLAIAAEALREAVDAYGKPGGPWNVPSDPGGWLSRATEALAKIEGEK